MKKIALPKARVLEIRKSIWRKVTIGPGCPMELSPSDTLERQLLIEAAKVASKPYEREEILVEIAESRARDCYASVLRTITYPAAQYDLRQIKGCALLRARAMACTLCGRTSWLLFLALGVVMLTWRWWLLYPVGIAWLIVRDLMKLCQMSIEVELAARLQVFRQLRQGGVG